jgi:hypothetical protein
MSNLDRHSSGSPAGFRLDRTDGKVFGVCSGLANYTGVDANLIRVGLRGRHGVRLWQLHRNLSGDRAAG